MMKEPQPLAPALSLKTAAPATPSKSVNFKISPVRDNHAETMRLLQRAKRPGSFVLQRSLKVSNFFEKLLMISCLTKFYIMLL